MIIGVDVRCLQDTWRTGVGETAWQILKSLSTFPNVKLVGFANAAKHVDLPPNLRDVMQVVHTRIPNKLKNLCFSLKIGEPIDVTLEKKIGQKLDVLWLPNPSFVYVSGKVPVVLTVHDLAFCHYPEFFPVRGKFWYFPTVKKLLKNGLPEKSFILTSSQHTADDVVDYAPILRNKTRAALLGVEKEYFNSPSADSIRSTLDKFNIKKDFILSVGTIEPRKNYKLLLEVYNNLVLKDPTYPYDLVIAGIWGWRSNDLKILYNNLPTKHRIHFLGYITVDEKKELYSSCKLFVYPSFYEGFGLPVLEAMAAGKPVVVSQTSSLPEVVGDAGLLLSPYKPEVWQEALNYLARDNDFRNEYAIKSVKQAQKFSWEKTAAIYLDVFNKLLS